MIIGLTGKAGSGKSTACSIMKELIGDIKQINFKDELLRETTNNFPDLLKELGIHDVSIKPTPPVLRALLRNYGTDVRRNDDPNYWVNLWIDSVDKSNAQHIVCDDVRFLNEARAVNFCRGIIVRIVRTDMEETQSGHVSETEMDQIIPDYTIEVETGNFDKLREELKKIV